MRRLALGLVLFAWSLSAAALEINDASRAQLEQLDGIGVATAERILAEREKGGPFRDWRDLEQRVPGLRGRNLQRLQRQALTVGGEPGERPARSPVGAAVQEPAKR